MQSPLVQCAVNGNLTEKGYEAFRDLHTQVKSEAGYKRPWLFGVEHLTQDTEGYVYWKGQHIEHWTLRLATATEWTAQAEELSRRCRHLEELGQPVNVYTVIWKWPAES